MKKRPEHARDFKGKAKNIPQEETFMLPYQEKWIRDRALIKLMEKTRRAGISYATSYDLVRRHARKENKLDSWVSSRDEASAKLFLLDCKTFAKSLEIGARSLGEQILDDEGNSAYVLRFANETDINSVSSNPDAFAGKGGMVRWDEFALRKDPKLVWDIGSPSVDWGGDIGIISTHRGSGNFFNLLIREITEKGNPRGISHHKVTLQDALDQFFLWKLQTKLREGDPRLDMDEADYFTYIKSRATDSESFLQEYMCIPADDAAAFLEYALIDSCAYPQGEQWELPSPDAGAGKELYAGVDIGRDHDFTSLYIMERVGGSFFTRYRLDLRNRAFSDQEAELYPWFAVCRRVCIDQTGIGRQFAERAQQRFGTYKVEGVTFTGPMKEELAYPVRSAFEDRAIKIPFGDDDLRADLRAIRKETTSAGNIRFAADRGKNGHADRFWALALALHAGKPQGAQLYASLP